MFDNAVKLSRFLDFKKAEDVALLDIRGKSPIADFFIIATGLNLKHTGALADALKDEAEKLGMSVRSKEGQHTGEWILIDLDDIVVHIMTDEIRTYYSLERLWHYAKKIELDIDTSV
jgi:ribosome-associated protein